MADQDPKVGKVGDDPLRPFLDPLQVDDSIKSQAWRAWHQSKTSADFQAVYDNLPIPQETKSALWRLKFAPPAQTAQDALKIPGVKPAQAPTPQPAAGPTPVSRPTTPDQGPQWFGPGWEKRAALGLTAGITGLLSTPGAMIEAGTNPAAGAMMGVEAAQLAAKAKTAPTLSEKAGYYGAAALTPVGGGWAANLGERIGQKDIGAVTEAAGAIAPYHLLFGRPLSAMEKGGTLGPSPEGMEGLSKQEAIAFQRKGFSAQVLSSLDTNKLADLRAGISPESFAKKYGTPAPQAAAPAYQAETPAAAEAPADGTYGQQRPSEQPLARFRGAQGGLRPWDPEGNRFQTGATVGMKPLDQARLDQMQEAKRAQDPITGGATGTSEPRPVAPQGIYQPAQKYLGLPGFDTTVERDPITGTPINIQVSKAGPTKIVGPKNIPGMPDPLQLELEKAALLSRRPRGQAMPGYEPTEPVQQINPQEIADLQKQLQAQGYKGEVNAENLNQLLRQANEIRATQSPRPDEITAIREPFRQTLEQPGRPEPPASPTLPSKPTEPPAPFVPTEGVVTPPRAVPVEVVGVAHAQHPTEWQLPEEFHRNAELMLLNQQLADRAPTPAAKAAALAQVEKYRQLARSGAAKHINSLSPDQRQLLYDHMAASARQHEDQAAEIHAIVQQHPVAKALRTITSERGPMVTAAPSQVTQFAKQTGKGVRATQTVHNKLRGVIHNLLRDQVGMGWDQIALNQQASAREAGLDPNAVVPEGYRRMDPEERTALIATQKAETAALQKEFAEELKALVAERVEAHPAVMQAEAERDPEKAAAARKDVVRDIHAQAIRELLQRKDENGLTLQEKIKDNEALLKRDPQRPIYVKKGVPIITPEGVVKAPSEAAKEKTYKLAKAIFGTQINKIPPDSEWIAKADEHIRQAKIARGIIAGLEKLLTAKVPEQKKSEGGFIGAVPEGHAPIQVPTTQKLVQAANKMGLVTYRTDDDKPAGSRGWLSPEGWFIDSPETVEHDSVAWHLMDKPDVPAGASQQAFQNAGWIRIVNQDQFSMGKPTEKGLNTLELSLIRNRMTGRPLLIDINLPGRTVALEIPQGWDDLATAIRKAMPGARVSGGLESGLAAGAALAGGVAGTVAGASLGHVLGGVHGMEAGAVMGYPLGFMATALLTSAPVVNAMKKIGGVVRNAGISFRQWFQGKPQRGYANLHPEMDRILREQAAHSDKSSRWIDRLKEFPAAISKGFGDPYLLVGDRKNLPYIHRVILSMTQDGKVFRGLTLPDQQSFYLSLVNAQSDALGMRREKNAAFAEVRNDANNLGAREELDRYLNLKAYERANETVQEHINDLAPEIQRIQQALNNPNTQPWVRNDLQSQLRALTAQRNAMQTTLDNGDVNPEQYNPDKVARHLAELEHAMGPQQWADMQQLANRVWAIQAPMLTMFQQAGLISQATYAKLRARGDEYIPMKRIMDDMAQQQRLAGMTRLDIRQQTGVMRLEGSERYNVSPWEGLDETNRRMSNEIARQNAMKSLMDLANQFPNTIAQELRPVQSGYKPKAGEGVLAYYKDGVPQFFAVPKYLEDTITRAPLAAKYGIGILGAYMSRKFREGVTIATVMFQLRSALTHMMSGAILSPYGVKIYTGKDIAKNVALPVEVTRFLNDWRKAAIGVIKNAPDLKELIKYGGASGTMAQLVNPEYFANPKELGFIGNFKKGHFLDAAQDFAMGVENINRLNIFRRARLAGLSPKEAAWETKQFAGMPFFGRIGTETPAFNLAFMFLQARLQYLHQAMTAVRKNPARVLTAMAMIGAMTVSNAAYNATLLDSHGRPLIAKETVDERERNWVVLTPWTYHTLAGAEKAIAFKVPKPPIVRYMLNPLESATYALAGTEVRTGRQQVLDGIGSASPIPLHLQEGNIGRTAAVSVVGGMHPLAKTAIEQFANVDDFGRPIVPPSEQGGITSEQYGPNTSAVAKTMGKGGFRGALAGGALGALTGALAGPEGAVAGGVAGINMGASGISPRRIDAAIRSTTGGLGEQATSLIDPLFGGTKQLGEMQGPEKWRHEPFIGGIVKAFTTSPADGEYEALSNEYYNLMNEVAQGQKTMALYLKEGRADDARRVELAYSKTFAKAYAVEELNKRIGEVTNAYKVELNSPTANTPEGRQRVQNLYEAREYLLRIAINLMRTAEVKASDTGPMGNQISNTSPSK